MAAVDSTQDVIFLADASFKITFVNAAFQTVTGFTIEEALGHTADFLRARSSRPKVQEYLHCVAEGLDWKGELLNRRNDGSEYPVEATIAPIFDKQGACLGYAAFERDITLRKRLEDELRLERNYALSIVNSLDAAVYTLDREFRLSHINDGWKKLPQQHGWLNMTGAPQAGQLFLDYVSDADKQAELQVLFETVLTQGKTQEIQASQPDGYHWSIKIVPWLHEGEVRGLMYVVTDQTKFHELQHQLFQSQKMETVGALAAGVAHDFNNLLQVIRGNVSLLLLNELLEGTPRRQLQQIDQAASRAADITQQLLSFSRASDEECTVLDFNQVIKEASQLAQRSLMNKVELELRPTEQPLKVRMDATRAQQLLLNLCVNALDAMPNGGRLVISNCLVSLAPEQLDRCHCPEDAEFVRCSVADTGMGIAPEILERIFEPFFTTKGKNKGTGLGLSIAQSIVNQAGGFIEVESAVGQGTTFHLYLPIAQAGLPEKSKPARPGLGKGTGRILVVDDLDLVLEFTQTFLEMAGFEVLVATSAEEALTTLNGLETPVDLIFTDYNMSGMNGRQLIQNVATRWPNMKFILASGYLKDSEREELEKEINVRILGKPFNMREAAEMIAEMLATNLPDLGAIADLQSA
jgi:PAS domain S-box-containing protein